MKKVKLYHFGTWYKVYGDDAKIVSFITDYKLFEDVKSGDLAVGFPEISIDKVIRNLKANKISYILPEDENETMDFGEENQYDNFLHNDLPYSYVKNGVKISKQLEGNFKIKFNDEPETEYIIGGNIKSDVAIIREVITREIGVPFNYKGEIVTIIENNIN